MAAGITSINGTTGATCEELHTLVAHDAPGRSVQLTCLHKAPLTTLTIVLAARPPGT
ncbi:MAG: hypothetical protein ACLQBX_18915 [Candidatus Limnocylindrales bacterium]